MPQQSIVDVLRTLESTEANLAKLERVWSELESRIPRSTAFGGDADYESLRRQYADLVKHLPAIDGWRIEDSTVDLNTIGQWRFDAEEVGEPYAFVAVTEAIEKPGEEIAEYRFRFDQKRRSLVRSAVEGIVHDFEQHLGKAGKLVEDDDYEPSSLVPAEIIDALRQSIDGIETLLGSSVERPTRWSDLRRHLHFAMLKDLHDIISLDWPAIKPALEDALYGENEPLPVAVSDLGELAVSTRQMSIPSALSWSSVSAEEFERLIFSLISTHGGYENPQWLMHTNAPDRGRDISAERVTTDSLSGTRRERVILQCKHTPTRGVSTSDITTLKDQMRLWEPPRIDLLIIVTSGRFSTDAVNWIERHNQSDSGLRVEMWPSSHLERLLATRPDLIAQFGLRR